MSGNEPSRLLDIIRTLRAPGGCPWDRDQTPRSMRGDLIEEMFEAVDAITQDDAAHVREELGDVLFVVLMVAYMYEQHSDFTLEEVFADISQKLVRRHPHVFAPSAAGAVPPGSAADVQGVGASGAPPGDPQENLAGGTSAVQESAPKAPGGAAVDSAAGIRQWDWIKEHVEGRAGASVLDGVPAGFPPLLRSYKMLKKASKAHFEYESIDDVRAKIDEELSEVDEARAAVELAKSVGAGAKSTGRASDGVSAGADDGSAGGNSRTDADKSAVLGVEKSTGTPPRAPVTGGAPFTVGGGTPALDEAQLHLEDEVGDLFATVVNYARWLGVDPEIAMDRANRKFYRRFTFVESSMRAAGIPMAAENTGAMVSFWRAAKAAERGQAPGGAE